MYIIPGFYGRNVETLFYVIETKSSAVTNGLCLWHSVIKGEKVFLSR